MGRLGGFRSFGALAAAVLALGVACAGRSTGEAERGTTGGTSGTGAQGGSNAFGGTSAGRSCVLDICGSGRVTREEACDDGNTRGDDGCSADCSAVEPGWLCPGEGLPCRSLCGDAKLVDAEECDDGNDLGGDGCSRACRIERPLCATDLPAEAGAAGAPSESEPPADDAGARIACVTPVCGDGVVTAPEDCDDGAQGNDATYGGCSTDCSYAEFCGDGIVNGPEECDSGTVNAVSYGTMGCSQSCRFASYCGDGFIDAEYGEQCDHGVRNGTASCRADCTIDLR